MRFASAAVAIALIALASSARAQVASTAFNQAAELEKQGKWAEACPLYETSYHADPQIGVLLYLAQCHEHIGRIASAAAEYNDAADLAHSRNDPREATARNLAAALAPKLPKLFVSTPSKPIAGLVVKRDGIDITALIGTTVPIDPGDHELTASAPGYVDWTKRVTIGTAATTTAIDLPVLDKAPATPVVTQSHEGRLKITTQADAEILLDAQHVAVGHYEAKVRSGGHTLRVIAPGMRPYQSEIVVGEDEERAIDVPLDKQEITGPREPAEDLPDFELGAEFLSGEKLHGDRPAIVAFRAEAALRRGRRVNFGVFVETGTISTGNACGFSMPGAIPATPFDFGPRNQFTNCSYLMPGLQLYIHILPKRRFDPYLGLAPGFRFGFTDWTPYVNGVAQSAQSSVFPAVVTSVRAGLNYHPRPQFAAWEVGAFFDAAITIIGNEAPSDSASDDRDKNAHFVSLLGGLRSTVTF